jgi:predicted NAD/FAD-dependent oxidoreductase
LIKKSKPKIAIVGAGLAGLNLARLLGELADVIVFEKSNKLGGRLSTLNEQGFSFDHGAQFFTAKNPAFQTFVKELEAHHAAEQWNARFVELKFGEIQSERTWDKDFPHYVGSPAMNSIAQYLARNIDLRFNQTITGIKKIRANWLLETANSEIGPFDWLIIAIPVEQANDLLPKNLSPKMMLQDVKMQPCFTLMLGYEIENFFDWDAAFVSDSILSWVSVNSSKPNRGKPLSIIAMSTNEWANQNLSKSDSIIINEMLNELAKISGKTLNEASFIKLKRWRYANASKQEQALEIVDYPLKLAFCGDWCISGRIESAFMSSLNLANKLKNLNV